MDATAAACDEKAAAAEGDAPSSPRAAAPEAVPGQQLAPFPGDAAAAVDSASATETTSTVESRGGGEDEQVEKFYALLANIRAMRDMYKTGAGASTDSAGGSRKRLRGAELPWRPAFRMEDFEEPRGSSSPKKERRDDVDGARRPGKETANEHGDDNERKGSGVVAPPPSSPSPPRARAQHVRE